MKKLGFGMMRLPVRNGDPTDFDCEQLNRMVDAFLEAGYTYFDTSFVYHNGKSEEAVRKALVERHPRDSYHGVPVTAILQAYSICQIQPDPGFSDDNNYLKNAVAEAEHVDFSKGLEKQRVIAADGEDITETVEKAVAWLTEHSF